MKINYHPQKKQMMGIIKFKVKTTKSMKPALKQKIKGLGKYNWSNSQKKKIGGLKILEIKMQ